MAVKLHDIKILGIQKETEDCVSVTFDIPDNLKNEFAFISGQYLTLEDTINGESVRRAYSLCSAPYENSHKVAIKKIENGIFSTHANDVLKAGDQIKVMKPNSIIINTLIERFQVTNRIGLIKAENNLDAYDSVRETEQLQRLNQVVKDSDLDIKFVKKIMKIITSETKKRHEKLKEEK